MKLELYFWLKKWVLSFFICKILFFSWSLRYKFLVASESLPYFFFMQLPLLFLTSSSQHCFMHCSAFVSYCWLSKER